MIKVFDNGVYLLNGKEICQDLPSGLQTTKDEAKKGTMSYDILKAHNTSKDMDSLRIKFDALASHDITYVGIIQTARASGLTEFPLPYVLTNCHNSLCAVGGTINEDDHLFGLSAAKKYGGVYVPAHQAVIHQYMREMMAGCGKMILGSDSHTRYGALGTMAVGEGGPELVKQLLGKTYDIKYPQVVGVYLTGTPQKGVGPQDVALAIIGAVFEKGIVKNKVMEFIGEGVKNLNAEYRIGIDVMTTETTCLTSIWETDPIVEEYLALHGRKEDYQPLAPKATAWYDGMIVVDLDKIKPMIALPFHPSNVYAIDDLNANLGDILRQVEKSATEQLDTPGLEVKLTDKIVNGSLKVEQGFIGGCAGGTFDNLTAVADILRGKTVGNGEFSLSIYPGSQPINLSLIENGCVADMLTAGATVRTAFCGPCFGAGDTPAHNTLSIRHATRNFPNREGSKPSNGQIASVALMDSRSIAATAINNGILTSASSLDLTYRQPKYYFNGQVYTNRVFNGIDTPQKDVPLKFGPNIADWPALPSLTSNILLKIAALITDAVTTTDELIPSGETSSYRSNPYKLAEFTLSRKVPQYVGRAKETQTIEASRINGTIQSNPELNKVFDIIKSIKGFEGINPAETEIGSVVYAVKPGDGSAREQAASCQRVLGGLANIAEEYATKRYRSNLINWGMLPLQLKGKPTFAVDSYIFVPNIKEAILNGTATFDAYVLGDKAEKITLELAPLTADEKQIILSGCLINYYRDAQ